MPWNSVWTSGYNALTSAQQYENASIIWDLMVNQYNWSEEATAGVLGNLLHEGEMNPGQWQHNFSVGDWDTAGLGLGQWTPASKLANYCGGRTEAACNDGDKQIEFLVTNGGQWNNRKVNKNGYSQAYETGGIPWFETLEDYSHSTLDPADLATSWAAMWEQPLKKYFRLTYDARRNSATYYYNEFSSSLEGKPITVSIDGNGTAYAYPRRGEAGDTISIHAAARDNDSFQYWVVNSGNVSFDTSLANTSFTMGTESVSLTAHFTGNTPPTPPSPIPTNGKPRKHLPVWAYPIRRY